jgi:hypothetical protein
MDSLNTTSSAHIQKVTFSGLICTLLLALCVSTPAQSELPRYSVHVGLRGGSHLTLDDFQLNPNDPVLQLNHGGLIGLTLGGYPVYWFGMEASADVMLSETKTGELNTAISTGADILLTFSTANFSPHFSAGGGVYVNTDSRSGSAYAPFGRWGIGLRGHLHRRVILRIDVRHIITRGIEEAAHNMTGTIGFDFVVFDDTSPDTDADGVADAFDSCPKVPGFEALAGCPDSDRDGVPDHRDRCKDRAGPKSHRLCVFGRAATLTDVRERCAAILALGCPDSDNDGLADTLDRCPNKAGNQWLRGCPDGDGDAVPDDVDQCPLRAGPLDRQGCPDTDNDGVIDDQDKCRRTPGPAEHKGCPESPNDSTLLDTQADPTNDSQATRPSSKDNEPIVNPAPASDQLPETVVPEEKAHSDSATPDNNDGDITDESE